MLPVDWWKVVAEFGLVLMAYILAISLLPHPLLNTSYLIVSQVTPTRLLATYLPAQKTYLSNKKAAEGILNC